MSKKFTYYGGVQAGLLPYLTAYWTAENIATDVYTNNLGGAFNSNPVYNTGINGQAFDFLNSNVIKYIQIPDNDLLSFTDGVNDVPFTINMWTYFYRKNVGSGNWLFNKRLTGVLDEYQFVYSRTLNSVIFDKMSQGSSGNRVRTRSSISPSLNTWEMWTISSDGTKFGEKIYRNGVDVTATSTETGTYVKMINTSAHVRMSAGGWTTSGSLKHRGRIDEVSLFNGTELTPTEITDLYNGGVGKFYPNI